MTKLRKYNIDLRHKASTISDEQLALICHISRRGVWDIGPLTEAVEMLYIALCSEGIRINCIELAVMLDEERQEHDNNMDARRAVFARMKEMHT